jgi:CheY-like chemotaxis protein
MPLSAFPELSSGVLLCIDDNQDVLECEQAFLESFGFTVLTALSGGKGLELASVHSVDVVIVDYFMPEMNGQEVAVEMRRLTPNAPIIMLSGALEVPEETLKLVDAFVAKDRLASQLLPAIAQLHRCGSILRPSYDTRWRSGNKKEPTSCESGLKRAV